jgi:hypothetical protein
MSAHANSGRFVNPESSFHPAIASSEKVLAHVSEYKALFLSEPLAHSFGLSPRDVPFEDAIRVLQPHVHQFNRGLGAFARQSPNAYVHKAHALTDYLANAHHPGMHDGFLRVVMRVLEGRDIEWWYGANKFSFPSIDHAIDVVHADNSFRNGEVRGMLQLHQTLRAFNAPDAPLHPLFENYTIALLQAYGRRNA